MKNIKLKLAIFKTGIRQKELAAKAQIPRAYISLGINGRYVFSESEKAKIADVLGKPVSKLF